MIEPTKESGFECNGYDEWWRMMSTLINLSFIDNANITIDYYDKCTIGIRDFRGGWNVYRDK